MAITRDEMAARRILGSIVDFSRVAAPRALRPYQVEAGEAIVGSVLRGEGRTFTVCMARQSGKNELSAQIEAYLLNLFAARGGQIVKAAPSFKPQVVNSQMRLQEILATPFSRGRWAGRQGYMLEMGRARVIFFSADPAANIVGATASLLLEVDEAQDVDSDVYFRDLRPMASTTRATTVLYGTPWTDDNILERQRRINIEGERRTGRRLNFEAPWTTLAAISPPYRDFVQGEIDRLGESHPTIRTQYLLEPVAGAGRLFPPRLLDRIRGSHPRHSLPLPDCTYAIGIDIAGQVVDPTALNTSARVLNDRDETVVTVTEVTFNIERSTFDDQPSESGRGEVAFNVQCSTFDDQRSESGRGEVAFNVQRSTFNEADEGTDVASPVGGRFASNLFHERHNAPLIRVVEHYRWRGITHAEQYDRLLRLLQEAWTMGKVCIDASGVGAGLASFLARSLPRRIEPLVFTAQEKSRLGFELLAAAEVGRLQVYDDEGNDDAREFWRQMTLVRYRLNQNEEMQFFVPAAEGHDDFAVSLALAVRAASMSRPPGFGRLLRAPPDADAYGW